MIQLKNVHIGYTDALLHIDDITLEIGNLYILVGKNGSGKSTFLKTITAQIPLISGEITIDNAPLNSIPIRRIPETLCFVPVQFPEMDYVRTCEFVAAGRSPYTSVFGQLSLNDHAHVDKALTQMDVTHLKDRFTSELSDGEKQLVAIAKALAQETAYIFLDEPTAFLDYSNKKKVLTYLSDVSKSLNKCVILSAHDIDLCLEYAANFLVVNSSSKTLELLVHPTKNQLIEKAFE